MTEKTVSRHIAEVNNLIHRRILSSEINKKAGATEEGSISHATACVISYLYDKNDEDIYQKDIEREFQVRRSTVSKELSLLEQKGLIKRVAVENDRRLKKIVLTQKSKSIIETLIPARKALDETITKGLDEKELKAFIKTLEKIKNNLTQEV